MAWHVWSLSSSTVHSDDPTTVAKGPNSKTVTSMAKSTRKTKSGLKSVGPARKPSLSPARIPDAYLEFQAQRPEILKAYEALGEACAMSGPLDRRTVALVKLAISLGAGLDGVARSHARKALAAGCSIEELMHIAHLCAPTIGFPSMMRARRNLQSVLSASEGVK